MVDRCRLAHYVTRRWHLLAAVSTVMTMPHAGHRLAALHRLLSSRHASAIECVSTESDGENSRQDASCKTHLHQPRSPSIVASSHSPSLRRRSMTASRSARSMRVLLPMRRERSSFDQESSLIGMTRAFNSSLLGNGLSSHANDSRYHRLGTGRRC